MNPLIERTTAHLKDILRLSMRQTAGEQALVIFDDQAPLTKILTEAYRTALPRATFLNFDTLTPTEILGYISGLHPRDLVILVQSANFRLNEFRIRIELFKRDLKTIEHVHLGRMSEDQFETYIDTLAYDSSYYHTIGHALKARLDRTQEVTVECDGTCLIYAGQMEEAKLNIGDYTDMKNIGGTFPIGEVFTEAKDLCAVNGEALVFGCAGDDHVVRMYDPFLVKIEHGILTAPDSPAEFRMILDKIREDEEVLVREFGLGLNRAIDKSHMINDITAFERQTGLHLSLGAKHAIYVKPGLKRKEGRYHVDIFVDAKKISIDGVPIFEHTPSYFGYTNAAYTV